MFAEERQKIIGFYSVKQYSYLVDDSLHIRIKYELTSPTSNWYANFSVRFFNWIYQELKEYITERQKAS